AGLDVWLHAKHHGHHCLLCAAVVRKQVVSRGSQQLHTGRLARRGNPVYLTDGGVHAGPEDCRGDVGGRYGFRLSTAHRIGPHVYSVRPNYSVVLGPGDTEPDHHLVESYVALGAAYIMLGFGGSRWTREYVNRYICLVISVGLKILTIYAVISAGMILSGNWITEAQQVKLTPFVTTAPVLVAFDVLIGTFIYSLLVWHLPRIITAVLGGSL